MPFPNETREGCIEDGELTGFWCFYSRRHDCFVPRRWWLIFSLLATHSSDVWYLQVAVEVLCPNSRYRTDCHRHPKFVLRALSTAMSTTELVTCGSQKPLQLPASAWSGSPDPVQMDRGRKLHALSSPLGIFSTLLFWVPFCHRRQGHGEFKMPQSLEHGGCVPKEWFSCSACRSSPRGQGERAWGCPPKAARPFSSLARNKSLSNATVIWMASSFSHPLRDGH